MSGASQLLQTAPIRIQFVRSLSNSRGMGYQNREQREKQLSNCFPGNLNPLGKIEWIGEFIMKHLVEDFNYYAETLNIKIEAPITGI